MNVVIKKTTELEKALEIAKSLPEYFNQQGLDEMKKYLPSQNAYGAYFENELIGFASYKKVNDETIELKWIMVKEKYQGQEVGEKLLAESLTIEGEGFSVCQVKTLAETIEDKGYAKTREFYKRMGFVPIEIIDPYPGWGPENPCQIMVKFLKK